MRFLLYHGHQGRFTYGSLDVLHSLAGGEHCRAVESLGNREDLRAVDHLSDVVTESRQVGEDELEVGLELLLVIYMVFGSLIRFRLLEYANTY